MVKVKARECPYDPRELLGQPIGMLHCGWCGCMVVAGIEHGPCLPGDCVAVDEGWHPGPEIDVEVTPEQIVMLGIRANAPLGDGGESSSTHQVPIKYRNDASN